MSIRIHELAKKLSMDNKDLMSLLKDRGYEFHCQIIGGAGTEQDRLKNLIAALKLGQAVALQPPMTQEELVAVYERATIFALPCQVLADGDRDGIPNVLVEAMAMKLPVVSTPVSGIPELIENGVNGLLVSSQDSAGLAAALETLLNDAELRTRLGETARQTVCRDFDIRQNVLALKKLFDEC